MLLLPPPGRRWRGCLPSVKMAALPSPISRWPTVRFPREGSGVPGQRRSFRDSTGIPAEGRRGARNPWGAGRRASSQGPAGECVSQHGRKPLPRSKVDRIGAGGCGQRSCWGLGDRSALLGPAQASTSCLHSGRPGIWTHERRFCHDQPAGGFSGAWHRGHPGRLPALLFDFRYSCPCLGGG